MFLVVYREGTHNCFEWHRTLPFDTIREANGALNVLIVNGYHGWVEPAETSFALGLPDTFDGRTLDL